MFKVLGPALLLFMVSGCGGSSESPEPQKELKYTISASASAGGTISPASTTVLAGTSTSFELAASTGFKIKSVSGCGGAVSGTVYTTGAISSNCAINAEFEKLSYKVAVDVQGPGTVTPASATIEHGALAEFAVVPDANAVVASVTSGCAAELSGSKLKTGAITANCNINVQFATAYKVTAVTKGGGSISPATQSVALGSKAQFTITENAGNKLKSVSGCDGELQGMTYTTGAIKAACQIDVVFNGLPNARFYHDIHVYEGFNADFDATPSFDPDGDLITYHWSIESKPASSSVTIVSEGPNSPTAFIAPDVAGNYDIGLVVNDGTHDSEKVIHQVQMSLFNLEPTAVLKGLDQGKVDELYVADGSLSHDPDNDTLTYEWTVGGSAAPINIDKSTPGFLKFTPTKPGEIIINLVVKDPGGWSSNMEILVVEILSLDQNRAPIADAGETQMARINTSVQLDGVKSFDRDGDALTYQWQFVSKPAGSLVELQNEAQRQSQFVPDIAGTYVVELVVSDGTDTGRDNVSILVDEPSVKLYSKDTEFGFYQPLDFPMVNRSFVKTQVVGQTQVELSTYKMTADGKDFVIENVKAVDTTGTVVPQIVGLTEGMTLKAGESVEFTLVSPLTNGATVELEYTFNIKGNNQTFVNKIQLTTN